MELDHTPTATVPAQPTGDPTPTTQSATHAATAAGSTSAYRFARRAERLGKPLAAVPVKAEAPAPAPAAVVEPPVTEPAPAPAPAPESEERKLSKRQQQINDYERRLAEQDQRMRALEARLAEAPAAPRSETPAVAQPDKGTPEWKRYAGLPDAPKLADFDSIEEHTAALSFFIAKTMFGEAKQADAQRARDESTAKTNQARASRTIERLQQADDTMPDWRAKAPPDVMAATPLSSCDRTPNGIIDPKTGQPATFANVVAEVVFDSPDPVRLLLHLADQPAEADRISRLSPDRWEPELARLDGRVQGAASAAAPKAPAPAPTRVLTAAPAPSQVVGSRAAEAADPKASAIRNHDTRAFRELRREERRAAMGR